MSFKAKLQDALKDPLWQNHSIGDTYKMDGKGEWKLVYFPILDCGKTGEIYNEPRALMETSKMFRGKEGTDFREVPTRYLEKI